MGGWVSQFGSIVPYFPFFLWDAALIDIIFFSNIFVIDVNNCQKILRNIDKTIIKQSDIFLIDNGILKKDSNQC